jgi:carbohydrate kinase (thermoresistant glucokinase family)
MVSIVVMGVSGCGKSTVASALARELGLEMIDGDDLHLPESVAKMRAGIALEDADRWPWLDRIGAYLAAGAPGSRAQGRVVACSALKRAYRDRIRRLAAPVQFVFLNGDAELIARRLALRTGHYMQPELLTSQFRTLEVPAADETDVVKLDISQDVPQLVAGAVAALRRLQAAAQSSLTPLTSLVPTAPSAGAARPAARI